MKGMQHESMIDTLNDCAAACNFCATACLKENDVTMMADCIRLDMDCADICTMVARFLARGSAHGIHLLKECAEICGLCADECEKHTHAAHCRDCAKACRACEQACLASMVTKEVFA